MKLITLGTSHGDPTYCRFNSSTLIEISGTYYLLDIGAPADALMIRGNYDCHYIRAIFNTHVHADHIGGLPVMMKSFVKRFDAEKHKAMKIFVAEEEVILPVKSFYRAMYGYDSENLESYMSFHIIQSGEIYRDENICVKAIPTKHMDYCGGSSFAFLITELSSGKKLIYTGDLAADFSDFPADEKADVCVCECTHYNPGLMQPIMKKLCFSKLIFNHIHNPWHGEEGEKRLLSLCADFPFAVQIAHDMDVFDI